MLKSGTALLLAGRRASVVKWNRLVVEKKFANVPQTEKWNRLVVETLGYCTTIAKVQGRTLDIIAIDPDLNAQSVGYTAITRVRDLSNLFWLKKPTAGFLAPPAFSKKK